MKKLFIQFKIITISLFLMTACVSKTKYQKAEGEIQKLHDEIQKLNNESSIDLSKLGVPMIKTNNYDEITFNVDLNNDKDTQIIHLSSDPKYLPFMLLCRIKSSDTPNLRGKIIKSLEIGVRSVNHDSSTFFKIIGNPYLKDSTHIYRGKKYTHILKAKMDLNDANSRVHTADLNISKVKPIIKGEYNLVNVKIDPKKLITSILSLNEKEDVFSTEQINQIEALCCDGVICSLTMLQ